MKYIVLVVSVITILIICTACGSKQEVSSQTSVSVPPVTVVSEETETSTSVTKQFVSTQTTIYSTQKSSAKVSNNKSNDNSNYDRKQSTNGSVGVNDDVASAPKSSFMHGWVDGKTGFFYLFNSDGTFYRFSSVSNLNDNYWFGTYTYTSNNEAISSLNTSLSTIQDLVKSSEYSSSVVSADDVYALVLNPSKIVMNGTDRSSLISAIGSEKLIFVKIDSSRAVAYSLYNQETFSLIKQEATVSVK